MDRGFWLTPRTLMLETSSGPLRCKWFFPSFASACTCSMSDMSMHVHVRAGDDEDDAGGDKALPRTKNEIAPPPPKRPDTDYVAGPVAKVGTITAVVENSVIIQVTLWEPCVASLRISRLYVHVTLCANWLREHTVQSSWFALAYIHYVMNTHIHPSDHAGFHATRRVALLWLSTS